MIEEVCSFVKENRLRLNHWFFTSDLKYLMRGGRVSRSSYILGPALGICPLLNVNGEGKLIPQEKIRSKKRVIRRVVEKMEELAEGGNDYSGKCFISQSACPEDAQAVAALIEERFPHLDGKVQIFPIGTVIGSHTGPGTVALFFWGKERS